MEKAPFGKGWIFWLVGMIRDLEKTGIRTIARKAASRCEIDRKRTSLLVCIFKINRRISLSAVAQKMPLATTSATSIPMIHLRTTISLFTHTAAALQPLVG